jgi:hypothetical protein
MIVPGWCSSFRKTWIGGYGSRLKAGTTGEDYLTTPISRKYFSTPR